jgi:quercetin dioxygenase-like cupin family protein
VLAPGERLKPHGAHSGEEFGYVIRGRVSIKVGRRSGIAKAGECFSYKAHPEHSLQNAGRSPAEVLFVTWPPRY